MERPLQDQFSERELRVLLDALNVIDKNPARSPAMSEIRRKLLLRIKEGE